MEDVKDGLLKVMLYKSIDRLELDGKSVSFKIALKLTSLKNKESLEEAISTLRSERKGDFYIKLLEESEKTNLRCFTMAMVKSPLKYLGGKPKAVRFLEKFIREFKEFREPVCGGASITLYFDQKTLELLWTAEAIWRKLL